MFDSISIRRQEHSNIDKPVDLGFLAEAMLFYGEVRIISDHVIFKQITSEIGPELLIELIENGFLKISYLKDNLGIATNNDKYGKQIHRAIRIVAPDYSLERYTPKLFIDRIGKSGRTRRLANRFIRNVDTIEHGANVGKQFIESLKDEEYLTKSVKTLLSDIVPECRAFDNVGFKIHFSEDVFTVLTNLNYDYINHIYHKRVSPKHSTITSPLLLSHFSNVISDLYFSAIYNSEISTDSKYEKLQKIKIKSIGQLRKDNQKNIFEFNDFIFNDSRALREIINSGERSFEDMLGILEKSRKFRKWLDGLPPDASLVKEYFQEVTSSTWIDKLPGKFARWGIFTGIGLGIDVLGAGGLGTAAGVAISASNQFFLDKMIKGWKPNQFVDDYYTPFVKKRSYRDRDTHH